VGKEVGDEKIRVFTVRIQMTSNHKAYKLKLFLFESDKHNLLEDSGLTNKWK
jgi:hypothetical protein